jgi:hypothetical protein
MSLREFQISAARKEFNRAFYGNGTIVDKIRAAYGCSIIYDKCGLHQYAVLFEKIGNYWYMQQDKFKTTVEE